MNMCANHPEKAAVAYCRMCGKPLCELCRLESFGAIYCAEHLPVTESARTASAPPYAPAPYPDALYPTTPMTPVAASPYTAPVGHGSPAAAVFLGMIPGVGAIYNGQYAKGLIHAVVFGILVTIVSGSHSVLDPLLGILIAVWWFYMVLEAHHTARNRKLGLPVDEFSSLVSLHGNRSGVPVGATVLIALGMLLLLDTTGLVPLEYIIRYWPAGLIVLGLYMLYSRIGHRPEPVLPRELGDERR